jgi:hypothetical protein
MATAQELGIMATDVVAAKVALDAALEFFLTKEAETSALVTAEQAAVDAASTALETAVSAAHETVGWTAAAATLSAARQALDTLNIALGALVPSYQQL